MNRPTFSEVFDEVKAFEEKEEMPLIIAGLWMNTNCSGNFKELSVELSESGTAAVIESDTDLEEYLERFGIESEFTAAFHTFQAFR